MKEFFKYVIKFHFKRLTLFITSSSFKAEKIQESKLLKPSKTSFVEIFCFKKNDFGFYWEVAVADRAPSRPVRRKIPNEFAAACAGFSFLQHLAAAQQRCVESHERASRRQLLRRHSVLRLQFGDQLAVPCVRYQVRGHFKPAEFHSRVVERRRRGFRGEAREMVHRVLQSRVRHGNSELRGLDHRRDFLGSCTVFGLQPLPVRHFVSAALHRFVHLRFHFAGPKRHFPPGNFDLLLQHLHSLRLALPPIVREDVGD